MSREELLRLAETATAEEWPAAFAQHLAEQREKTLAQRLEELETSDLLLSVGFLRVERTLERLIKLMERK